MIKKERIVELANQAIADLDVYIAEVLVKSDSRIYVFLDSDNSVHVENCIVVSKFIESKLDRDAEDFELNVSSYGANQPLIFPRQYVKNVGRSIDIVKNDETELIGVIKAADEIGVMLIVAPKKKKDLPQEVKVEYSEIKEARIVISFK